MSRFIIPNNFLNELNQLEISKIENDYPKISIVMPSYNQAQFIEKSILSILNQNYPNTELIIIDGGSNDGTIDKIKKYEDKIKFWISEKDQGQSDALNKGFARCTGDIYGWLNSDDVYLPNTFKNIASIFSKNKDKKIVFGDWLNIGIKDDIIDYHHAFDFNLNHFKYEGFHLNATSMFWKSEVHDRFSGFDVSLYYTMDYQLILELGINEGQNSFERIPKVLAGFRMYEGQKTTIKISPGATKEHKYMADIYKYSDKYKFIGRIKRLYFRIRRAWWYNKRGGFYYLIRRLKNFYVSNFKV